MYPHAYKQLLAALRHGPRRTLPDLVALFPAVRSEIESNRDRADVIEEQDPVDGRMAYASARAIVERTVDHRGFLDIDGELHDSVDDCADLLIDLDEIERLEAQRCEADVWWHYLFVYDSHCGEHMTNLERQAEWLTGRSVRRADTRPAP